VCNARIQCMVGKVGSVTIKVLDLDVCGGRDCLFTLTLLIKHIK